MTDANIEAARAYAAEAERLVWEIEGVRPAAPKEGIRHVCVIGGGRMGSGIATALLQSGLEVSLVEPDKGKLDEVSTTIRENWAQKIKRGQLTSADVEGRMKRLFCVSELSNVEPALLYIEAAWESMAVKKEVFAQLDELAPEGAVLATNTSTLDIDEIAASTSRPENIIGLHFFNPAYVMRLLEIVRGEKTAPHCIATALELAQKLHKIPVVVRVCQGFVGNRMFSKRDHQAKQMLIEGASPQQVDRVLVDFGFPMGTFELYDMVGGIELAWRIRQETGNRDEIGDALYHAGRLGVRAGKGYYRYFPSSRQPLPDPEFEDIVSLVRARHGIVARQIADQEIIDRMILPMVNEAVKILEEGIVERASDIDVVWVTGYGWPIDKGGPVYLGDKLGLKGVVARLRELQAIHGDHFAPSELLVRLADEGKMLRHVKRQS